MKTQTVNLVCKKVFSTMVVDFGFYDEKGKALTENDAVVNGFTVDAKDAKSVIQVLQVYTGEMKKNLEPK